MKARWLRLTPEARRAGRLRDPKGHTRRLVRTPSCATLPVRTLIYAFGTRMEEPRE